MTITKLIKDLKSGKIRVDFRNGWLDLAANSIGEEQFIHGTTPMEYLIETLEMSYEMIKSYSSYDLKREKSSDTYEEFRQKQIAEGIDQLNEMPNGALCVGNSMEYLKLYSYLAGEQYYITFSPDRTALEFKKYKRPINDPYCLELTYPDIPDSVVEPLRATIQVKSSKLIFTNVFPKTISPDSKDERNIRISLEGMMGRQKIMGYLASVGVLFAQMSNMSVSIWVSKDGREIIVADPYYEDRAEDGDDEQRLDRDKFDTYIKAGGFINKGEISCDVWRWEATDYENGKKVLELKKKKKDGWDYKDIIEVEVSGTSASMEHYYDAITKSPISKYIYSHIWIK